jgi:hypothetical protein
LLPGAKFSSAFVHSENAPAHQTGQVRSLQDERAWEGGCRGNRHDSRSEVTIEFLSTGHSTDAA